PRRRSSGPPSAVAARLRPAAARPAGRPGAPPLPEPREPPPVPRRAAPEQRRRRPASGPAPEGSPRKRPRVPQRAVGERPPRAPWSPAGEAWTGAPASGRSPAAQARAPPRPRSPAASGRHSFGAAEVQRQRELDEEDVGLEPLVDDELVAEVESEGDVLAGEEARAQPEVDRGPEHRLPAAAGDIRGDALVHHRAAERAEHLEVAHARVEPGGLAVDRRPHHVRPHDPVELREGSGAHAELRLQLVPEPGLDVVREQTASHLPRERIAEV